MKELLEEMLLAYNFDESEAETAIDFVQELLEEVVDYTEDNEPYATEGIKRMKTAIEEAKDLRELLYEHTR